jgi:hypothetical protein
MAPGTRWRHRCPHTSRVFSHRVSHCVSPSQVSAVTGSGSVYYATLTMPLSVAAPDGTTITVDLPAAAVVDLAANGNLASTATSVQFSRLYDPNNPVVTLTTSCAADCNAYPITVTLTFNEEVENVAISDVAVGGSVVVNRCVREADTPFPDHCEVWRQNSKREESERETAVERPWLGYKRTVVRV